MSKGLGEYHDDIDANFPGIAAISSSWFDEMLQVDLDEHAWLGLIRTVEGYGGRALCRSVTILCLILGDRELLPASLYLFAIPGSLSFQTHLDVGWCQV